MYELTGYTTSDNEEVLLLEMWILHSQAWHEILPHSWRLTSWWFKTGHKSQNETLLGWFGWCCLLLLLSSHLIFLWLIQSKMLLYWFLWVMNNNNYGNRYSLTMWVTVQTHLSISSSIFLNLLTQGEFPLLTLLLKECVSNIEWWHTWAYSQISFLHIDLFFCCFLFKVYFGYPCTKLH